MTRLLPLLLLLVTPAAATDQTSADIGMSIYIQPTVSLSVVYPSEGCMCWSADAVGGYPSVTMVEDEPLLWPDRTP